MCLIINKPEGVTFDQEFLRGTYEKNSDGLGVMYAENNTLYTAKIVPKTFAEVLAFWDKHVHERACAVHFRMQTHGDIDLHNCHPYTVLTADEGYPLSLIHNGILHTGNAKDKRFSDTHWYIQDYLRPMLLKNPEFFLTPEFADLVGSHIGNGNKFVLMDAYGNVVTVNEKQGVQHNGAWLSNTYAWDIKGTKFDRPVFGGYGRFGGYAGQGWRQIWDDDEDFDDKRPTYPSTAGKSEPKPMLNTRGYPVDDYEEDEAYLFADEFFQLLTDMKMTGAWAELEWEHVEAYFDKVGSTVAYDLLEAIEYGAYTNDELVAEILTYEGAAE